MGINMLKKIYRYILPAMLVLLLLTIFNLQTVSGYGTGHPDTCQPCHGQKGTTNFNTTDTTQVWNHDIQSGQTLWSNCLNCHGDYTKNTVHDALDCMGCHAVMHVGQNYSNQWAVWIFAQEPNLNKLPAKKPNAINWQKKEVVWDQTNYTNAPYASIIYNIMQASGGEGMEIEVGVWNGVSNEYISASPLGTIDNNAWKVCFSCHFVSTNPASTGAYKLVGGVWKLGIPEYALKLPPHSITEEALAEAAKTNNMAPWTPSILLGILTGLIAVGLVIYSKRGELM